MKTDFNTKPYFVATAWAYGVILINLVYPSVNSISLVPAILLQDTIRNMLDVVAAAIVVVSMGRVAISAAGLPRAVGALLGLPALFVLVLTVSYYDKVLPEFLLRHEERTRFEQRGGG